MAGGIRVIEQTLSAGSDFNGALPDTQIIYGNGLWKYPESAVGGLFDFVIDAPVMLVGFEVDLGGQSEWTLHKRDLEGNEMLFICGTTEGAFFLGEAEAIPMTAGQLMVLRTTGASERMIARMAVRVIR